MKAIESRIEKLIAQMWNGIYRVQYRVSLVQVRHGQIIVPSLLVVLIALSFMFSSALQRLIDPYFSNINPNNLSNLRSLFLNMGSALIGASAIAFSIVVFAMQVNVERMPHGLFRRFSTDTRILSSFAGTFLIAILIASASLIPDSSWVARAVIGAVWGVILVFGLFINAYRRALVLINPLKQLTLISTAAGQSMQAWVRRSNRITPLLKEIETSEADDKSPLRTSYDMPRMTYFQLNPQWSAQARQAILHAMSFARRYAEQGDHEISLAALKAVVAINRYYVNAKGKTFFAQTLMLDNPLTTDEFINNTLELLRQNLRAGISRGDEQQIEQTLQAMAMLVGVFIEIDYSRELASKTHAHIAAGYLAEGVKAVVPHDMPDVLMEGVALMGKSANNFLAHDTPNGIVTLAENIAALACTGCANEKFRPVTLTAMEQLAGLTFNLIRTEGDIRHAVGELREDVLMVTKLFLKVPDTPLQSIHSSFLAPYFSCTTTQALLSWLTELVNALSDAKPENTASKVILQNIEIWADGLYQDSKEILLLAIENRSGFTFDILHWIASVTKILLALSNADACEDYTRDKLRKHAHWLIYVLDWIPDDENIIKFVEVYRPSEILFEASMDAHSRGCLDTAKEIRQLLIAWAFKGGRYQTGWATLEQSVYALVTLALATGEQNDINSLKRQFSERLAKEPSPSQEIRDRTARDLRRKAETLYRDSRGFETRTIAYHMNRLDQEALRSLLLELANILSPETEGEPVDTSY